MPSGLRISWLRVLAEATVIVFSILVAFAIDAWWDSVQEEKHLHTVLTALESGFSDNVEMIDRNVRYVNQDRELLNKFIGMTPEDASRIPLEESFSTLEAIWRPGTNFTNSNLLIATLDSENLPLTNYLQLQEAISLWRVEISELEERAYHLAENEREALRALARHPEVRSVLAMTEVDDRGLTGDVMRRVREDQEVMSLAGRKAFLAFTQLQSLNTLRERSLEVVSQIQSIE